MNPAGALWAQNMSGRRVLCSVLMDRTDTNCCVRDGAAAGFVKKQVPVLIIFSVPKQYVRRNVRSIQNCRQIFPEAAKSASSFYTCPNLSRLERSNM